MNAYLTLCQIFQTAFMFQNTSLSIFKFYVILASYTLTFTTYRHIDQNMKIKQCRYEFETNVLFVSFS